MAKNIYRWHYRTRFWTDLITSHKRRITDPFRGIWPGGISPRSLPSDSKGYGILWIGSLGLFWCSECNLQIGLHSSIKGVLSFEKHNGPLQFWDLTIFLQCWLRLAVDLTAWECKPNRRTFVKTGLPQIVRYPTLALSISSSDWNTKGGTYVAHADFSDLTSTHTLKCPPKFKTEII